MYKKILLPAGLLSATIIGAGVFALPYVFQKAGLIPGIFYLAIFGGVFVLIHLMYADTILKTQGSHRFAGYAEIYLGRFAKWLTAITTIAGMILVLVVYLILSASFINLIFPGWFDSYKIVIFWLLGSLAIFLKINRLALSDFIITLSIVAIILIIFIFGLENLNQAIPRLAFLNFPYLFIPYGAVLFSLNGRVAIPQIINYFQKNNLPPIKAKTPIILGTLIPAVVYFLFIAAILALSGNVSQDAVSGLLDGLPFWVLKLLGVLGIISIWSTYIVIGRDVENSMEYDFHLPKLLASLVVIFLPLALYLIGLQNFLNLVSFIGGVFIGLEGILIVLIWRRAMGKNNLPAIFKNKWPAISFVLLAVFVVGIIYEIVY